jgi:leader peptidase (prepilin peptidase)/N-methyltransferase
VHLGVDFLQYIAVALPALGLGWVAAAAAPRTLNLPAPKPWLAWLLRLSTAALITVALSAHLSPATFAVAGLAFATPALVYTDLLTHRLPNVFTYGLIGWALACGVANIPLTFSLATTVESLVSGLAAAAVFWVLNLITRGGMGLGDVKLAAGIGLVLGFGPAWQVIWAFAFAFISGAVASLIGVAARRISLKSSLPFGPFLLLGAWISLLAGPAGLPNLWNG